MKYTILLLLLASYMTSCSNANTEKPEINNVSFSYSILKGLEPENGITRRDPSDVILADGKYYVWYTRTDKSYGGYNASVWYASSIDGETWEEKGEALAKGERDSWDEYSVFTPNILKAKDKYYLFYTGVKPTPGNEERIFENNSVNDFTAIGIAVSDNPDGPYVRISSNPILEVSNDPELFDSYRVDDACLVYFKGKYYLYYKGRSLKDGKIGWRMTKMGVAISDNPEGPYKKHENNPLITSGHEVMVWPYKKGMMALVSNNGPEAKTFQFSADGIQFERVASIENYPHAPGSFRVGDFKDASKQKEGISWGISMFYGSKEKWPHLLKYEMKLEENQGGNK